MARTGGTNIYRPSWIKIANAVVRKLDTKKRRFLAMEEQRLIKYVCKKTGLNDFGDETFCEPLELLCGLTKYGKKLTFAGRLVSRDTLRRRLINKLKIQDYIKTHPEVLEQKIERPVFILGLPRSGTTLLQRLLAQDPAHRTLRNWEMTEPVPPPHPDTFDTDPRIKREKRRWKIMEIAAPGFKKIHEVESSLPDECLSLMANDLISGWYMVGMYYPKYQDWLYKKGYSLCYPLHKRQLLLLQVNFPGMRWVLKSPWHLFGLKWLLDVYPDARIIQTHRDPLTVVPSCASLLTSMRSALQDNITPAEMGEDALNLCDAWLTNGLEARQKETRRNDSKAVFIDVHYKDLAADPMGTIEKIYHSFDLDLTGETRDRIQDYLNKNPRHKHGKHSYCLEQYNLTEEQVKERFQYYYDYLK